MGLKKPRLFESPNFRVLKKKNLKNPDFTFTVKQKIVAFQSN